MGDLVDFDAQALLKASYHYVVERAGAWAIIPFVCGAIVGWWLNSTYVAQVKLDAAELKVGSLEAKAAAAVEQAAAEKSQSDFERKLRSQVEIDLKKAKADYSELEAKYSNIKAELDKRERDRDKAKYTGDPLMADLSPINKKWMLSDTAVTVMHAQYSVRGRWRHNDAGEFIPGCTLSISDIRNAANTNTLTYEMINTGDAASLKIGDRTIRAVLLDFNSPVNTDPGAGRKGCLFELYPQ
jgi:hypothetical protein